MKKTLKSLMSKTELDNAQIQEIKIGNQKYFKLFPWKKSFRR